MTDTKNVTLDTNEQKVSYGFGWQFGSQLQSNNFEGLELEAVIAAITDCYKGQKIRLSEQELNDAYAAVEDTRRAADAKKAEKMAELGNTFLEENAKRDGVEVTESGVQYEILEAGDGKKPGPTDKVRTHYHGTFIDGSVFDSSVDRNQPAEFGVNQVIAGWTEILQMMPIGSKWRITVPYTLAYGEAGSPPAIPPKTVLVFEIHLIDIV